MHRGSASRIAEQQKQQHSSSSIAAAAQQQWWRRRRVAVFGPSTPGQTRTPKEENGTPKLDIFSGLSAYYALRISIANSRSSSTAAAAQQEWWQRRRGYGRKGRAWIHRRAFRTSRVVVREFHRASSGTVFPRLLPCDSLTNIAAAVKKIICSLYSVPLRIARSLPCYYVPDITSTAAVARSLTTY